MLAAPVVAALAPALPRPPAAAPAPGGVALPPLRPLPRSLMERCGGLRAGASVWPTAARPTARPSRPASARRRLPPPAAGTATAPAAWSHRRLGWPAALLALLLLLAALLAPEAPQDQAAICQRHNGAVACRVW